MRTRFLLLVGLLAGCSVAGEAAEDDGEPPEAEALSRPSSPDETATPGAPAPLDTHATELIDVRGLGDSAWANTHEKSPIAAEFGAALDHFDPTGQAYRGDVTFINWETVVGNGCNQFANVFRPGYNYAFVSRPENLTQANDRGINLIAGSNNHARDCLASADTPMTGEIASADMTAKHVEALGAKPWIYAGISTVEKDDAHMARVATFDLKGRPVRVAFGSIYMGRAACPRASCSGDKRALLESLRDAPADIRILSLHSMAAPDQAELAATAAEFIAHYKGDVAFGQGPHVWKPVNVVRRDDGKAGVVFESLGNFLHPGLAAQTKNFIGRALFDKQTLALRQVQLLPVANSGRAVTWSPADVSTFAANLNWTPMTKGVYANIKQ